MSSSPSPRARVSGAPEPSHSQASQSGRFFGLFATLALLGVAVVVGLLTPRVIPDEFLQESGLVERSTFWVYIVATIFVLLCHRWGASVLDTVSACVLLLAMAAREEHMHIAMFGISILKTRFYFDASFWQIAGALGTLLPVVFAAGWLLKRHGPRWLAPLSRWSAPMLTVALMVGAMVLAKLADRAPDTLVDWHLLDPVPPVLLFVLLSVEEILEWALPAFAIIAAVQVRTFQTVVKSDVGSP